MAESEMKRTPDPQYLDFRPKPKWEYTHGLICSAMLKVWKKTGDEKFFNYAKSYADSMINKEGEIKTYKLTDYNIDRVNPGKFLIDLYKETGQENYKIAIETLRSQMKDHPRTSEGGFWHKKRYPHQMWLDGIYMGSPFLAKYAVNFNEPQLFDHVANQIYLIDKHNYDSETVLYYHGWDESREQKWANKETGLSENFWGRGMGWLAMALVDVLDYFPKDHPKREMILQVADRMAQGIVKYQDENSGVWYQVLNKGGQEGNYLEASASSMFCYFLLKGTAKGYIDEKYVQAGVAGYQGILKEFIAEGADGNINITNVCAVAGLGGDPYRSGTYEYYINETKRDNDPKAVGPFIMASLWYDQLNDKM
ncbi:glycoside hydrolase family 88 protein [Fulvivirga sp. 2943]|uniref:Glycoside hydrolase family 88 protein n=2 Tax=Fulvivirga sediminis TaxID=2803949 RepID=A0A937K0Z3_9BACT|nr:glycoside hydrolase family 88 protein [Fulvivirga sediminis]